MNIILNQPYSFQQLGKRENQEDARYPNADVPARYAPFFLVCDGVGGCEKGEIASNGVCQAFRKALASKRWDEDFTDEDFQKALNLAYSELDKLSNAQNEGMATTLTFVAFHANGCFAAHIGDSRIYHVRPGSGILYRSDDHSLVNALVHSGNLTPEEAINHPDRNVITRYIGTSVQGQERSKATVLHIDDIQANDYFFLCSDGVLSCVSDRTLLEILSESIQDNDKMLKIARLSQDSDDNNTAYLIPIASVQGGPGIAEAESSPEDNKTTFFSKRPEQAREVVSIPGAKTVNGFRNFFKNLFSRNNCG